MGDLVFGGMSFNDFGVEVDGIKSWDKPQRDTTSIHVPGRSGDLIIDNGCWKNIDITYHCYIRQDWKTEFPKFVDALYRHQGGYEDLTYFDNSGTPHDSRMAEFKSGISPDIVFAIDTGEFDLTFNCKPYMIVNGMVQYADFRTEDVTLQFDNSYGMIAYPLITIDGATDGAYILILAAGGGIPADWLVELAPNDFARIRIDCEIETCTGYDTMDENPTDASSILTITKIFQGGIDRDYPYLDDALGQYMIFVHEVTDGEMPPTVLATYTGTAAVDPRFTRI